MLQGDRVELELDCEDHASLLLESQGNQHLYRCNRKDGLASQCIEGKAGESSKVIVMPQPTVMHQDAEYHQTQKWDVQASSNVIIFEPFHAGRSENNEVFSYGSYRSDLQFSEEGKIVFVDRFLSEPGNSSSFHGSRFGNYPYMLNIYSLGRLATEVHREISAPFLSQAQLRVSELKSKASIEMAPAFCTSIFDPESGVLVTRAMAHQRQSLEGLCEAMMARSVDFYFR
jgi:urease accessory protein UreH